MKFLFTSLVAAAALALVPTSASARDHDHHHGKHHHQQQHHDDHHHGVYDGGFQDSRGGYYQYDNEAYDNRFGGYNDNCQPDNGCRHQHGCGGGVQVFVPGIGYVIINR